MKRLVHAFQRQSLSRQLVLQLSLLVTVMLTVLTGLAYVVIGQAALQVVPPVMRRTVALHAAQQGQVFLQAEASVQRLSREWLRRIDEPADADIDRRWAQLFERQADGVWRLQQRWIDTERAPTFYLQHGTQGPDASTRRRAVVSHQLLAEQGPALVPPFFSVYTDFVEKGLMVFSRGVDWGRSATPATDNFSYPTMTGSDPARNPQRQRFWTPVYFDSEAHAWMVSVIQPLDWRGRWVGTVGHDITIDALLRQIIDAEAPMGSTAMILSGDGQLIAHPELHERIAQAQGQLALKDLKDPVLDQVHGLLSRQANSPEARDGMTADGRYLVAWSRMPGPDWWSVRIIPRDSIDQVLRTVVRWMLGVGALGLLLTLLLLRGVVRRRLYQPLETLSQAIETQGLRVRGGEEPSALPAAASPDLNRLTQAFDTLAAGLAAHRREERSVRSALEHEVQERRQAEESVRLLNLSLEARVQERGRQLQQAHEELVQRETLASLGSLVAGVSHELNTPIGNALMGADTAAETLRSVRRMLAGPAVRRGEMQRQLQLAEDSLHLTLGNLQRSAGLVRDFKQVAIDRASLQRRPFRLRQVCEEVVHLLHHTLKGQQHEVLIELPEALSLDSYPGPFGQVLTNLVQNAVIHAFGERQGGLIRIELLAQDEDRVHLAVSDNGRGIAPEHLDQVFKPFFTTRLGQGGSGLGLHLVYTIVCDVLGGHIELSSRLGDGTRFVLTLPRVAPTGPQHKA
ncbi:sensor histidine kinase [Roseateles sp. DB2]|uniref:sensor histidine kinase n=1 Tax=Roseateles sp. DB2 TaxID=3453717 RepID=UPI003EEA6214